jgi:hypothetical protein
MNRLLTRNFSISVLFGMRTPETESRREKSQVTLAAVGLDHHAKSISRGNNFDEG